MAQGFPGTSRILTRDRGYQRLDKVKVGEHVATFNLKTGKLGFHKVTEVKSERAPRKETRHLRGHGHPEYRGGSGQQILAMRDEPDGTRRPVWVPMGGLDAEGPLGKKGHHWGSPHVAPLDAPQPPASWDEIGRWLHGRHPDRKVRSYIDQHFGKDPRKRHLPTWLYGMPQWERRQFMAGDERRGGWLGAHRSNGAQALSTDYATDIQHLAEISGVRMDLEREFGLGAPKYRVVLPKGDAKSKLGRASHGHVWSKLSKTKRWRPSKLHHIEVKVGPNEWVGYVVDGRSVTNVGTPVPPKPPSSGGGGGCGSTGQPKPPGANGRSPGILPLPQLGGGPAPRREHVPARSRRGGEATARQRQPAPMPSSGPRHAAEQIAARVPDEVADTARAAAAVREPVARPQVQREAARVAEPIAQQISRREALAAPARVAQNVRAQQAQTADVGTSVTRREALGEMVGAREAQTAVANTPAAAQADVRATQGQAIADTAAVTQAVGVQAPAAERQVATQGRDVPAVQHAVPRLAADEVPLHVSDIVEASQAREATAARVDRAEAPRARSEQRAQAGRQPSTTTPVESARERVSQQTMVTGAPQRPTQQQTRDDLRGTAKAEHSAVAQQAVGTPLDVQASRPSVEQRHPVSRQATPDPPGAQPDGALQASRKPVPVGAETNGRVTDGRPEIVPGQVPLSPEETLPAWAPGQPQRLEAAPEVLRLEAGAPPLRVDDILAASQAREAQAAAVQRDGDWQRVVGQAQEIKTPEVSWRQSFVDEHGRDPDLREIEQHAMEEFRAGHDDPGPTHSGGQPQGGLGGWGKITPAKVFDVATTPFSPRSLPLTERQQRFDSEMAERTAEIHAANRTVFGIGRDADPRRDQATSELRAARQQRQLADARLELERKWGLGAEPLSETSTEILTQGEGAPTPQIIEAVPVNSETGRPTFAVDEAREPAAATPGLDNGQPAFHYPNLSLDPVTRLLLDSLTRDGWENRQTDAILQEWSAGFELNEGREPTPDEMSQARAQVDAIIAENIRQTYGTYAAESTVDRGRTELRSSDVDALVQQIAPGLQVVHRPDDEAPGSVVALTDVARQTITFYGEPSEAVVLHELAHVRTGEREYEGIHGPEFRDEHIALVREQRGPQVAEQLADAYVRAGFDAHSDAAYRQNIQPLLVNSPLPERSETRTGLQADGDLHEGQPTHDGRAAAGETDSGVHQGQQGAGGHAGGGSGRSNDHAGPGDGTDGQRFTNDGFVFKDANGTWQGVEGNWSNVSVKDGQFSGSQRDTNARVDPVSPERSAALDTMADAMDSVHQAAARGDASVSGPGIVVPDGQSIVAQDITINEDGVSIDGQKVDGASWDRESGGDKPSDSPKPGDGKADAGETTERSYKPDAEASPDTSDRDSVRDVETPAANTSGLDDRPSASVGSHSDYESEPQNDPATTADPAGVPATDHDDVGASSEPAAAPDTAPTPAPSSPSADIDAGM